LPYALVAMFWVVFAAADSFITKEEYARMLYQNPRGIGCHKCHGIDGRGLELGRYREGNRTVVIKAPDITNLSYRRFFMALKFKKGKKRVDLMPTYFLTDREIKILYYYLKKRRR